MNELFAWLVTGILVVIAVRLYYIKKEKEKEANETITFYYDSNGIIRSDEIWVNMQEIC